MQALTSVSTFSILLLGLAYCTPKKEQALKAPMDIQGHRGARGLMPENTIPAFIKALELGVTTLELDLAVTKDKQLLVSHEPYMSASICLDTLGNEISEQQQSRYNIYQMSLEEVRQFDCGSKKHDRFPDQEKFRVTKPLLSDVVDRVNAHPSMKEREGIKYNIEIKSHPDGDGLYHPEPSEFSDLLYNFIQDNLNPEDVTVQSFDFRVLQYFHEKYPTVTLAVLIENERSIEENLDELGFVPQIYSCYHKLLDEERIEQLHTKGMKVIPWTINEVGDMKQLISWGVDGIITDYPDRAMSLISE